MVTANDNLIMLYNKFLLVNSHRSFREIGCSLILVINLQG
jgi:hypothetical protein